MPSPLSRFSPVLSIALAIAGCDRGSAPKEQANAAAPAAPAPIRAGAIDRSHHGEAAPTLAFTGPNGKPTSLAAFRGHPVLMNLWATWCAPCVAEMPALDRLAATLPVVAISQDLDGEKAVAPFFAKAEIRRLVPYLDTDTRFSMTMNASLPLSILYDAEGREVWRVMGAMDWDGDVARKAVSEAR